ncbi:MAG: thioredoxin [Planctomycetes bacterium]|nr:thioredoxin [Planctomycetota bacterium]
MAGDVQEATDGTFAGLISGAKPVFVDFWAEWCGPCRAVGPVFKELAAEMSATVTFAKVNVDQNQETAGQYNVTSIPCLILFRNGKEIGRRVGSAPKSVLKQFLAGAIAV